MTENPTPPTQDEESVLLFNRSQFYALLLPLAFVTGIAAGFLMWGRRTSTPNESAQVVVTPTTRPQSADPATPPRFDISTDDDPALGPEDAPITIVEFSDFACGYCRRFHEQTFPELLARYPDQIRFVYRDLPVVGGYEAAQAAECADEQGAFWEFHDLLFTGELGFDEDAYREYAEAIDIDADELSECLAEERFASEVESDARYAMDLGATGTPTFFINGIPLVGAQPIESFINVIESELDND